MVIAVVVGGCAVGDVGPPVADVGETTSPSTDAASTSRNAEPTEDEGAPGTSDAEDEGAPDPSAAEVVVGVIDGDTLDLSVGGQAERLRLIGIDAPERGECGYQEAASLLSELVSDGVVRLETDLSDRDQFGRLLRYLWVGEELVNESLVEAGVAIARPYPPDVALAARLADAQTAAQKARVGLWSGDLCGDATDASLEVSAINHDAPGEDNTNLNGEWIELTNVGSADLDLAGWTIRDESASHRYSFPMDFRLDAGATVRLHTGCGNDTALALHWCMTGSAVWNNSGDTVFVLDPSGNIAVSRSYSG